MITDFDTRHHFPYAEDLGRSHRKTLSEHTAAVLRVLIKTGILKVRVNVPLDILWSSGLGCAMFSSY